MSLPYDSVSVSTSGQIVQKIPCRSTICRLPVLRPYWVRASLHTILVLDHVNEIVKGLVELSSPVDDYASRIGQRKTLSSRTCPESSSGLTKWALNPSYLISTSLHCIDARGSKRGATSNF